MTIADATAATIITVKIAASAFLLPVECDNRIQEDEVFLDYKCCRSLLDSVIETEIWSEIA